MCNKYFNTDSSTTEWQISSIQSYSAQPYEYEYILTADEQEAKY